MKKLFLLLSIAFFSFSSNAQVLWSDPASWGGSVPIAGDSVVIPMGTHILLDVSPPNLSALNIMGTLEFDTVNLTLTVGHIIVMGRLEIGTQANPYTKNATINVNGTHSRGIMVMGGQLEMHGLPTTIPYTKINAHAPAGSSSLSLLNNVDWNVGDAIIVSPTDYYEAGGGNSVTEQFTINNVSNSNLTLSGTLSAHRWGLLQYATTAGMSLSNANVVTPPDTAGGVFTPTVLDERAYVANLSRNILIQAPNDALWTNNGFGVHIMIMRAGGGTGTMGVAHLDGVEIFRGGQRGVLGRYPFHWHMLSYHNSSTLGDATGQYIRNSSIHNSTNRGIVVHGTNGTLVQNNVIYDVLGHGIFTEDASERRNTFHGNLVLHIRNQAPADALKLHETGGRGASGFWISNPDNTIINNISGDNRTNGFWLAFPNQTFGLSANISIIPNRLLFGVFRDNIAFSNRLEGINLDFAETDNLGNISTQRYNSTTDGQDPSWPWSTLRRFEIRGCHVWKNSFHGFWDRSRWPDTREFVSADNCGRYFAGAGDLGLIERCLVIGTSLNHMMNGTDRPNFTGEVTPSAFATYHSDFDIQNNIAINFQAVSNTMSGVFATNDYYLRPVEKGQIRNLGNLIVNSHPGVKLQAPHSWFTLAGALWDPRGVWGSTPGQYLVYDSPFFTHGKTSTIVAPNTATTGGVLVDGPFYGFNDFVVNRANNSYQDFMELRIERLDSNLNLIDTFKVAEAIPQAGLEHMRHFATTSEGFYHLSFPNIDTVYDFGVSVTNMDTTTDFQILAVEFDAAHVVDEIYITTLWNYEAQAGTPASNFKHIYAPVADFSAVVNSPNGEVYWQDPANNLVWVKIRGGIDQTWAPGTFAPDSDQELYWEFKLRIFGTLGTPLAVNYLDFSADLKANETVELNWKTASEINSKHFVVERSGNGINWMNLESIGSQGNSTVLQNYATIDQKPLLGTSYYRIKQVDLDGSFTYSEIETIELNKKLSFEIYPNPSSGVFQINGILNSNNLSIQVSDSRGKILSEKPLRENRINISDLPYGLYFIKITNKLNGNFQIKKIVKL